MTSEEAKLFSEIIDRQIALQELEAAHDKLARSTKDPATLRASKAKIRTASVTLKSLKAKAGLPQTPARTRADRPALLHSP